MGFLRVLGWIFVPYIMIFVRWKQLRGAGRAFGIVWASIALLMAIGNLAGGTDSKATTAPAASSEQKAPDKAQKEADAQAKKEEAAKAKAEAEAKAKAEAEEKAPHLGESTKVGNIEVGVGKEVKMTQKVGKEFLNQKAQGTYWVFNVGIKNGDKAARMIDTSMFQLVSSDGTKYEPDSTASMYANEAGKFFMQNINPGIESVGFIVFDMPNDAKDKLDQFKLKVDSGVGFKAGSSVDFILKAR